MSTRLLETKFFIPPLRAEHISRPALVQQLNQALDRKLTLVSAPAGFGKTTLLSEWANQSQYLVSWVSLDDDDNEVNRFWGYFVATLSKLHKDLGRAPLTILQSQQNPPIKSLLGRLINEIAMANMKPFAIVLDDYHLISAPEIHAGIEFLIENCPPPLHLIIATRFDPQLPLGKWRAGGVMNELCTAELRFKHLEARDFFNRALNFEIDEDEIAALERRTEGWAAGFQMAAIFIKRVLQEDHEADLPAVIAAFTGSHRYVTDYFVQQVITQQDFQIKDFLLKTSILDRFTASLCQYLTGYENSRELINHLDRTNLFLTPIDYGSWYRYHHLFAELLRSQLAQSMPEHIPELHMRASLWYEEHGMLDEAVQHAIASSQSHVAVNLIERYALKFVFQSEVILVRRWLQKIPEKLIRTNPKLCIIDAWARIYTTGALPDLEKRLVDAADLQTDHSELENWIEGHIAAIRIVRARQSNVPPEKIKEMAERALSLIGKDETRLRAALYFNLATAYFRLDQKKAAHEALDDTIRVGLQPEGDLFLALVALYAKGQEARLIGDLQRAEAIFQEALISIVEPKEQAGMRIPVAGSLYIGLGSIYLEWNQLEKAEGYIHKGMELIAWTNETSYFHGAAALGRLNQIHGDPVPDDPKLTPRLKVPSDQVSFSALCIWMGWAKDDPLVGLMDWTRYFETVILARHRIARYGRGGQSHLTALGSLQKGLDDIAILACQNEWVEVEIETLILKALTLNAYGQMETALQNLKSAVHLAKSGGYVRIFLDEGPVMRKLLHNLSQHPSLEGTCLFYVAKLLDHFKRSASELEKDLSDKEQKAILQGQDTPGAISRRELEVLLLLATGMTNQEIAQNLFISHATVKQHLKNIYRKLDVHNRTQAVHKARERNIIQ